MSETLREGVLAFVARWAPETVAVDGDDFEAQVWKDAIRGVVQDLAALLAATAPTPDEVGLVEGLAVEERWVPIDENGERWAPRDREAAEIDMDHCPVGGTYGDGAPMPGIVRVVKEVRRVTPWEAAGSLLPTSTPDGGREGVRGGEGA